MAGHTAIKMLSYFECLELELKKGVQKAARANEQQRRSQGNESPSKEDDLAQITGGKEAEIEQYCQMLTNIQDQDFLQKGYLSAFLEPVI